MQDLQRQSYHRSMYFNELNRNKRSVCIDMSKPEGRVAFLELVKTVDVVLENNSARVMPNFGLGYDDLRAVKPDIIMVSMSGYGASGPHRDWVAYGANIETTSSLTSVTGYPDGRLSRTTLFYADPVSGNYATIAILAALRHRSRTGRGSVGRHLAQRGRGHLLRRNAHRIPADRNAESADGQPRSVRRPAGSLPMHRYRQLGRDLRAVRRRVGSSRRADRAP